jgi:dipeptide/tripeptide permease
MLFQLLVSRCFERVRPMPSFIIGLVVAGFGLGVVGLARTGPASLVFLGVFLFAVGEMICSPRIQEYITWLAPKEKAGLYMGSNFLGTMIGALSGLTYTPLYGFFNQGGRPEMVWYVLALHFALAAVVFWLFVRLAGEFREQTA